MIISNAKAKNAIEIFRRAGDKNQPVIFMTDTIYGIGAPLSDKSANDKIFDIKGRDRSKPFPVLVSSMAQVEEIAMIETDEQRRVLNGLWPGPFTFILKAKPHIDSLYTINGTIALRMPDKEWLLELINNTGALSATSANPSGVDYVNDEEYIYDTMGQMVEFFIFDNNLEESSSTIIKLTDSKPEILRKGHIPPQITLSDYLHL